MAVEYKGIREAKTDGGTSITIQIPAVAAAGDLLIAYISKDDDVAIYNTGSYGDWNMVFNNIANGQSTLYIAWRFATADDVSGAVSWTWNADSEDWIGEILCYSGVKAVTPIHGTPGISTGTSATPTAPSVAFTDLAVGSLVLQVMGIDQDDNDYVVPSQLTSRFNTIQANDIGGAGGDRAWTIAPGWVSPTGHNDPDTQWTSEENAYDEDTGNYAHSIVDATSWSSYLELTINAIKCSKVRFYITPFDPEWQTQISLDVYYSSAWHNIYEGAYTNGEWVEKAIGSTETVTAMRAKFYNAHSSQATMRLNEAEFWDTNEIGETGTAVFTATSRPWAAATLVIEAAVAAGMFYKSIAGVFTATGSIVKLPKISLAGTFSSVGLLTRKTLISLAGTFGLTGIVSSIFRFPKSLAGTFGLTGTIIKLPKITLSGVFSPTGTIGRLIKKGLSGVFNLTGTVGSAFKFFKSLVGTFGLTGTIVKLPKISLSGTFSFAGETSRKILISLAGVFSSTGTIVKLPKISLSSVFNSTGTVGRLTKKSFSGAFNFVGNLASQFIGDAEIFYKSLAGTFGFTGGVSNILTKFKSLAGTFSLSGTVNKLTKRALAGAFNLTGVIVKLPKMALSGTFNLTGSIGRLIKKTLSGSFTFSGIIFFKTFWNKVIKVTEDWSKVVKGQSWFVIGWFHEWFGTIWDSTSKTISDWTKVNKDTGDWTKVDKSKDDWDKVDK